jgi:hypothetical protein
VWVAALSAASHAAGEGYRAVRLMAVMPASPNGGPPRGDRRLYEHWWWGQCGVLDTTLVARRHGGRRDALTVATIVQVAGYDLELAALLARRWEDGRVSSLRELLRSYARAHPDLANEPADDHLAPAADRPTAHSLAAWSAGSLDRWDDRLFGHPCAHLGTRRGCPRWCGGRKSAISCRCSTTGGAVWSAGWRLAATPAHPGGALGNWARSVTICTAAASFAALRSSTWLGG